MSGQIVDATIVATPKLNTAYDRRRRRSRKATFPPTGRTKACEARAERPGCALDDQILQGEAARGWGMPAVDLAIPAFGYKNHVSIDQGFGLIRNWTTTHAAAAAGHGLVIRTRTNTASDVWADTAYRSAKNEAMLSRSAGCSVAHPSQRSRQAGRCLTAYVSPTRNPKSAARSSTCSRIRKDQWASSCARSA